MSITNEKLQTIKDNVSKVYHSGQMDVIQNAASLKGFESSEAMLIDDISPVTHEMSVKVRGKNLFDNNKLIEWGFTLTDSKYTGSVDGLSGKTLFSNFAENKRYTVSLKGYNNTAGITTLLLMVYYKDGTNITAIRLSSNEEKKYSFTTAANKNVDYMKVTFYQGDTIALSYIQIEEGTTATAYTPYIPDLTAVKVKKQGKNLIPFPYRELKLGTSAYNGVDFTVNEDGSILINGTATSNTTRYLYNNKTDLLGLKSGITISCSKNTSDDTQQGNIYLVCNYYDSTGTMQPGAYASTTSSGKKTITDDWKGLGIYLHIPKEKTINNLLIKPQITIGDTADNYESYITPTEYTPTADGTVNGVTSLYPNTTLTTDTEGVIIDCDYYKDIDKAYNELSSAMALSGGE